MLVKSISIFIVLFSLSLLKAQNDLRLDEEFFKNRSKEYSIWLTKNDLGNFFYLEKVNISLEKVSFLLRAKFIGEKSGDSLRTTWKILRGHYYASTRHSLHVVMLSKMSFQLELPLDSIEITIYVPTSKNSIHIFGEREGPLRVNARWEEFGDNQMGSGNINIPVGKLNDIFRSGNTKINKKSGVDLAHVRQAIRTFVTENYEKKGTDWIWKAQIDSSNEIYNKFSYTITHISREILNSQNFFELHQIDISIGEGIHGLEINWTFQAKYGGGLIFPPRNDSNDYHDFETSSYKEQFTKYQSNLFNRMEAKFNKL